MRRTHVAVAAVGLATMAAFLPVVGHGFINWDDDRNVYENPRLDPVTPAGLAASWRRPSFHIYMPVTETVWAAIAPWSRRTEAAAPIERFDPRPFHAANVLLHALNAILVVAVLRRLGRGPGAASLGALVFALHPVQVEPVAWVTGLKDVLAGFWSLVAILLYVAFAAADPRRRFGPAGGAAPGRAGRTLRYAFATLAFVLAMLSKPTAVVLPLLVAWLDRAILRRRLRSILAAVAPWLILSIACVAVNRPFQPSPSAAVPPAARVWVALDTLGFDLVRILVPLRLAIDYGRTPQTVLDAPWHRLAPWLALACMAALVGMRRKTREWAVAAGVFAVTLLPVLGLVPFGFQDISTVADRYLYLAMLGPAMAVAVLATHVPRRAGRAPLAAIVVGLGVASVIQVRIWQSPSRLFGHTLEINPRSRIARFNLGVACAADGRTGEAARQFEVLLERNPRDAEAENCLGMTLVQAGRPAEGVVHFRRAAAIEPGNSRVHLNLAGALARCQRLQEAEAEYLTILASEPQHAVAHFDLATLLAAQGRSDEAALHFEAAARADPRIPWARPAVLRTGRASARRAAAAADPTPRPNP